MNVRFSTSGYACAFAVHDHTFDYLENISDEDVALQLLKRFWEKFTNRVHGSLGVACKNGDLLL